MLPIQRLAQSNPATPLGLSRSFRQTSAPSTLLSLMLCLATLSSGLAQELPPPAPSVLSDPVDAARQSLAEVFASLVEQAVPRQYEKRKDWGRTKNVTVGLRTDGLRIHRRKKPVNHGVWKHYKVTLLDPDQQFDVRVENLRAIDGGRVGFTLVVTAKIDTWLRAKIYQYGIHLIAIEVLADTNLRLSVDCVVAARVEREEGPLRIVVDPRVTAAHLALSEFHLRRVSNADGPLIRELSSELREVVEDQLDETKLAAKLNRAIDKKRDRLTFGFGDLVKSSWWPLANLPDVQRVRE